MFDFCFQRRLVAFAAVIGLGAAGCSGSRALLPGTGPAAQSARSITHAARGSHPGAFTRLASQPPVGMQMAFLMTDGTVLAQSYSGNTWYKYTPDANGSYANGTWTQVASLQTGYAPERICIRPARRRASRNHRRRIQHAGPTTICSSSISAPSTIRSRRRGLRSAIPRGGGGSAIRRRACFPTGRFCRRRETHASRRCI